MASSSTSSASTTRARKPPQWRKDYEDSDRLASSADQWSVNKLLDTRLVEVETKKGKARKRRQYLTDWGEDWEASWVDAKDVSEDLIDDFWQEREADERKAKRKRKEKPKPDSRKDSPDGSQLENTGIPKEKLDVASLHSQCVDQLVWLFSSFFVALSVSGERDDGYSYRSSFNVPCSAETFMKCFCQPFAPHFLGHIDDDLPVRLYLSVNQVKWILQDIEDEKGYAWYHRDSHDNTSSCINGLIYLVWQRPVEYVYSHANCRRCNAGRAARTSAGDIGGLDICKPSKTCVRLPHQLHVSFHKMFTKPIHWKV